MAVIVMDENCAACNGTGYVYADERNGECPVCQEAWERAMLERMNDLRSDLYNILARGRYSPDEALAYARSALLIVDEIESYVSPKPEAPVGEHDNNTSDEIPF